MTNYPQFAQIENTKYKINTDYRVALRCEEIGESNISDQERALAIIYLIFGDKGLEDVQNWEKLLKIALKYLNHGKSINESDKDEEANMDFKQDWSYIQASFFSDYNIDLSKVHMHWYQFYDLLCGLTEKCVLSRVRFVRDYDISQIKDSKEKEKWIKQKEQVALKHKETPKTAEQKRLDDLFEQQLKGR